MIIPLHNNFHKYPHTQSNLTAQNPFILRVHIHISCAARSEFVRVLFLKCVCVVLPHVPFHSIMVHSTPIQRCQIHFVIPLKRTVIGWHNCFSSSDWLLPISLLATATYSTCWLSRKPDITEISVIVIVIAFSSL